MMKDNQLNPNREANLFLMLEKAKSFDESHHVSASATTKVAELSDKIGAGADAIKSMNEKYQISNTTNSEVSATEGAAAVAANNVVNNSYFSKGALLMSGALNRAVKAAIDLDSRCLSLIPMGY